MIGLIPKLLLDLVEAEAGEEAAQEVRRSAGTPLDRQFRLGDPYPDTECLQLLEATCAVLSFSQEATEQAYAKFFIADALERWPAWFEMAPDAEAFLSMVPTIHNSLASGIVDPLARSAINDKFDIVRYPNKLVVTYRSGNHLCGLYRHLAQAVLDHYDEQATIEELSCTKHGAQECCFHITWPIGGSL